MGKLDKILEKVQKTYKVDIVSAEEAGVVERLTLDSPGLNYAFGGGMPLGRMLFFQGPESGGKTTLSTYLALQVQQKLNKIVVFFDYEYTFDTEHAKEMGLDVSPEKFVLVRPSNAEDGFNMMKEFVDSGEVGLVIIDSVSAMSSKAACEDAFSGFSGGKTAAVISQGIRLMLPYLYNNKCTMIMLSQERANIGAMYGPDFKATGGRAPAFYSSWSARVTRTGDITDANTKELCGIEMRVRNTKNKVGIAKRDANLKLQFVGGIDSDTEYVDYLKVLGLVTQKGAYYSNDEWVADDGTVGVKVCGLEALSEFFQKNPKLYDKVKDEVNKLITGHNSLDERELDDDGLEVDEETGEVLNPEVLN